MRNLRSEEGLGKDGKDSKSQEENWEQTEALHRMEEKSSTDKAALDNKTCNKARRASISARLHKVEYQEETEIQTVKLQELLADERKGDVFKNDLMGEDMGANIFEMGLNVSTSSKQQVDGWGRLCLPGVSAGGYRGGEIRENAAAAHAQSGQQGDGVGKDLSKGNVEKHGSGKQQREAVWYGKSSEDWEVLCLQNLQANRGQLQVVCTAGFQERESREVLILQPRQSLGHFGTPVEGPGDVQSLWRWQGGPGLDGAGLGVWGALGTAAGRGLDLVWGGREPQDEREGGSHQDTDWEGVDVPFVRKNIRNGLLRVSGSAIVPRLTTLEPLLDQEVFPGFPGDKSYITTTGPSEGDQTLPQDHRSFNRTTSVTPGGLQPPFNRTAATTLTPRVPGELPACCNAPVETRECLHPVHLAWERNVTRCGTTSSQRGGEETVNRHHVCTACHRGKRNQKQRNRHHVCTACLRGKRNPKHSNRHHVCTACHRGKRNQKQGNRHHVCTACPRGKRNSKQGNRHHICTACPRGKRNQKQGNRHHFCTACPRGRRNPKGSQCFHTDHHRARTARASSSCPCSEEEIQEQIHAHSD
ncbi:uncharacterized protein LOC128803183 [Vidua macroura]|uniref:uncharacterized protein LOC128803183 n=1 Tax=Vidua macroura TaxID=187451 RepID=UPI0023A841BD|nr:uncharacterized protein LOC128803183 [Vidua macroura]